MIGDPRQHVGKPGLGIDVVELGGLDQRVHDGCAVAARVRAAEGPVAAADRDAANGSLGGIVRQADAAVVEEARERLPVIEGVVDRFGKRALRGELLALASEPFLEAVDEWLRALPARGQPLGWRPAVDLALDRKSVV